MVSSQQLSIAFCLFFCVIAILLQCTTAEQLMAEPSGLMVDDSDLEGLYDAAVEADFAKRGGGRAFMPSDKRGGGRAFSVADAEKRGGGRAFMPSDMDKRGGGRAFLPSDKRGGGRAFLPSDKRAGGRAFLSSDAEKRAGGRSFRFLDTPQLAKRAGGRGFRGFYGGGSGMNSGYYAPLYTNSYPMLYEKKAMSTSDYMPYYMQQYKRGGGRQFSDNYWNYEQEAEKEKRAGGRNFPIFTGDTDSTEKRMGQ